MTHKNKDKMPIIKQNRVFFDPGRDPGNLTEHLNSLDFKSQRTVIPPIQNEQVKQRKVVRSFRLNRNGNARLFDKKILEKLHSQKELKEVREMISIKEFDHSKVNSISSLQKGFDQKQQKNKYLGRRGVFIPLQDDLRNILNSKRQSRLEIGRNSLALGAGGYKAGKEEAEGESSPKKSSKNSIFKKVPYSSSNFTVTPSNRNKNAKRNMRKPGGFFSKKNILTYQDKNSYSDFEQCLNSGDFKDFSGQNTKTSNFKAKNEFGHDLDKYEDLMIRGESKTKNGSLKKDSLAVYKNFKRANKYLIEKAKLALMEVLSPDVIYRLSKMDPSCIPEIKEKVESRLHSFIKNQIYLGGDFMKKLEDGKIMSRQDYVEIPNRVFLSQHLKYNLMNLNIDTKKIL